MSISDLVTEEVTFSEKSRKGEKSEKTARIPRAFNVFLHNGKTASFVLFSRLFTKHSRIQGGAWILKSVKGGSKEAFLVTF